MTTDDQSKQNTALSARESSNEWVSVDNSRLAMTDRDEYATQENRKIDLRSVTKDDIQNSVRKYNKRQNKQDGDKRADHGLVNQRLYGTVGLLLMEIKRLHWKISSQKLESESPTISNHAEHIEESTTIKDDSNLQLKFNVLLQKYASCRDERDKLKDALVKLQAHIELKNSEVDMNSLEFEKLTKISFLEKNDIYGKYRQQEETISKLESKLQGLESELDWFRNQKIQLEQLKDAHKDCDHKLSDLSGQLESQSRELSLSRHLLQTRDAELAKLNVKASQLLKIAQEYSEVKQMLDICRLDVDAYKASFVLQEGVIRDLRRNMVGLEKTNGVLKDRAERCDELMEDVRVLRELVDEKDTHIQACKLRIIDQDLERYQNNELSTAVAQLEAKIELAEKLYKVKVDEGSEIENKLSHAIAKIADFEVVKSKLSEVSDERNGLLSTVYELKNQLTEVGVLKSQAEEYIAEISANKLLIDRQQKKLESQISEQKEQRNRLEACHAEKVSLQKQVQVLEKLKTELLTSQKSLEEANCLGSRLKENISELQKSVCVKDETIKQIESESRKSDENLNETISQKQSEINDLKAKLTYAAENGQKITSLEASISSLNDLNLQTQSKLTSSQHLNTALHTQLADMQHQASAQQQAIDRLSTLQARHAELVKSHDDARHTISDMGAAQARLHDSSAVLEGRLADKDAMLADVMRRFEVLMAEAEGLKERIGVVEDQRDGAQRELGEKGAELEGGKQAYAELMKKYGDLQASFDKYLKEYEIMSNKYERMSVVNDDHISDIEDKAFTISQLQKRMVVQMIELYRVDSLRQENAN